ncbi:MAG TPA: hypothetical protein VH851_17190 [Candidatus Binatia bacterium]|jgi:hypothetical protein
MAAFEAHAGCAPDWRRAEISVDAPSNFTATPSGSRISLTLKIAKQLLTLPAVLGPGAMTIKEISERFDAQSLHEDNSIRFKIMRTPIETKG